MNKYALYEASVQSPKEDVDHFCRLFEQLFPRPPRAIREDFCGTFVFSCAWVKKHPSNTAIGLDLDDAPLQYGFKHHYNKLKPSQKKQLNILQQNVLTPTKQKVDLIVANNFSFNIFKTSQELLKYFKACHGSLKKDSILILEVAGGPGMIEKRREQRKVARNKSKSFTYFWDQKRFDPITHEALYAIHFRLPDGTFLKDAFTYDWRLWTIPEIRELLFQAGFAKAVVFWEKEVRGQEASEYLLSDHGTNDHSWIAYVGGIRL